MLRNKRHTEVYAGSCVGDGAVICPTAHVSHSVIGRHCQIKDGAVLRNAYLMDGVVVEEGARVSYSILCSGAVVKAGGQVSRGCMLGQGYVTANDDDLILCMWSTGRWLQLDTRCLPLHGSACIAMRAATTAKMTSSTAHQVL